MDAKGAKRSVKMCTTNFYRSFSKTILWCMSSRLSKICSVHTYVMPRTVYFGWICTSRTKVMKWIIFIDVSKSEALLKRCFVIFLKTKGQLLGILSALDLLKYFLPRLLFACCTVENNAYVCRIEIFPPKINVNFQVSYLYDRLSIYIGHFML